MASAAPSDSTPPAWPQLLREAGSLMVLRTMSLMPVKAGGEASGRGAR
jgi:hypothetical protein